MNVNVRTARMAGLLYLIYIIVHVAADVVGRSSIIVLGDAAATARNILGSPGKFRMGFLMDLLAAVLFLITAWALYRLLKPVNENVALLFLLLNATGVAIQCVNDLFLPASQLLLSGAGFTRVWSADQLQAMVMSLLYFYKNGNWIAQIFYGAWLFPLGYCVFKSGFLPRILGIVLMIHCCTWLAAGLQFFLFPAFKAITFVSYPLGFIAEAGLGLWLVIKGVTGPR